MYFQKIFIFHLFTTIIIHFEIKIEIQARLIAWNKTLTLNYCTLLNNYLWVNSSL